MTINGGYQDAPLPGIKGTNNFVEDAVLINIKYNIIKKTFMISTFLFSANIFYIFSHYIILLAHDDSIVVLQCKTFL